MEDIRIIKDYEEAMANGSLPEMPEALDEKCRKLIENAFIQPPCRSRSKHISASIARAAVVVLLLFGLSTVMVLSVDAFRVPVLNFILDKSGEFSTVVLDLNSQNETADTDPIVEQFEKNIPKGYRMTNCDSSSTHKSITYENKEGHLLFLLIDTGETEMHVDAENVDLVSVEFGEYYAVFWEKQGYHLMWLDDEHHTIYRIWASDLEKSYFWEFVYTLVA